MCEVASKLATSVTVDIERRKVIVQRRTGFDAHRQGAEMRAESSLPRGSRACVAWPTRDQGSPR
jgi:hypothetical protein